MVVLSVDHVGTSMHNITLHKIAASLRASRSCNYCNCIVLQKQPYHYPSYNISCSHQRNYMSYDTVSTTNEYDVPTIKAENQGYVPPLVRLQSAVIQYPSVSGDHIDGIGLHDDNNVDGNNKHIMHQQNSPRHWNNKQQSTEIAFDGLSCTAFKLDKLSMGEQARRIAAFEESKKEKC